jgi:spermidine synthase
MKRGETMLAGGETAMLAGGGTAMLAGATVSEHDGVRYLHLGTNWVQGAMRIAEPQRLELEYVQRMMAWMLWREPPRLTHGRVVQLGLGAGALTRFTRKTLRMKTIVVENNPSVISACRLLFRLPADDARLQVLYADADQWVRDPAQRGIASVLNVDLYDHEAAAPVLDDPGFYAACRGLLADDGLMSVNLFGRHASFDHSMAHIAQAFGSDALWWLKPTREGNTIAIASRGGLVLPERPVLALRAANIEARCGLAASKWLRILNAWKPKP